VLTIEVHVGLDTRRIL